MTKVVLPGQNEPIQIGGSPMNPIWYERLKFLEKLQPLSDIVFPPSGVSSIDGATGAFTFGYGLARTAQALRAVLTGQSAAIGANVALNNTGLYFDGPSVSLAAGTWFVTGTVTLIDTAGSAQIRCKLWDGTTVVASCVFLSANLTNPSTASLSGIITLAGTATVKISCRDISSTSGLIIANTSGDAKDSHITAVRIA